MGKTDLVSVGQENGEAVICIRDNGMGISKETLENLNTGNIPPQEDKHDSGNGVGLANVRERLRLYFDRVDVMAVESGGEGKGASVTIRVPVLRGDAGAVAEAADMR